MASNTSSGLLFRVVAGSMVAITLMFLFNVYLTFWLGWPSLMSLLANQGWFGLDPLRTPLEGTQLIHGWIQFASYLACVAIAILYAFSTPHRPLRADASLYGSMAAYVVRAAFWSVLLVGLADMIISMLRVEGFLNSIIGENLTKELGRPHFRGTYVHIPLIGLSLVIAAFSRGLGFIWLAMLVVFAEFQIVISRFVFSYEQAFMGDLVRFWYAALFLFASAYALVEEGHVRVDVFYAGFSHRGKAWANLVGTVFLGWPLCWIILTQGMWARGSSINSPLLSFEISQSGFGMYTKYLMAGFLVVFAVSMIMQFSSYFLNCLADLRDEPGGRKTPAVSGH